MLCRVLQGQTRTKVAQKVAQGFSSTPLSNIDIQNKNKTSKSENNK